MRRVVLLVLVVSCLAVEFRKEWVGANRREAVGVYDEQGNSMYGVILQDGHSYEQVVQSHKQGRYQTNCQMIADDQDINTLGIRAALMDTAQKQIGCSASDVHFDSDVQRQYGQVTCVASNGPFLNTKDPVVTNQMVSDDAFTNQLNTKITKTFKLDGKFTQSFLQMNEIGSAYKNPTSFSIQSILDIIPNSAGFNVDSSVSAQSFYSQTAELPLLYHSQDTFDMDPQQCIQAGLSIRIQDYIFQYKVSQMVQGNFFANFSQGCAGHHYWFLSLSEVSSKYERVVQGKVWARMGSRFEEEIKECK